MPGGQRAAHLGPEKRREPILDAALAVFGESGFDQASMNAIAERAEISKAVLYDCFPGGKQEMFDALAERTRNEFVTYLRERWSGLVGADLEPALRQGMEVFLTYAEFNPPAFKLIFGGGLSATTPAARMSGLRDHVVRLVADGAVESLGVDGEDAAVVELYVRLIVASGVEMARWTAAGSPLSPSALVALTANLFMHGFDRIVPDFVADADPDGG